MGVILKAVLLLCSGNCVKCIGLLFFFLFFLFYLSMQGFRWNVLCWEVVWHSLALRATSVHPLGCFTDGLGLEWEGEDEPACVGLKVEWIHLALLSIGSCVEKHHLKGVYFSLLMLECANACKSCWRKCCVRTYWIFLSSLVLDGFHRLVQHDFKIHGFKNCDFEYGLLLIKFIFCEEVVFKVMK